ncbi:MarR family winged helix-turn-helix transcriptional regulator [Ilyobacter polytropus]|uniref:Transcriptional regulator, MarR family n=1 Tax=Ilyobacter polytropus (strain ATCC 51220 / DSM 2926 / LMG 16218 / CuHBu1) TaxID=572544 RepID=E3H9M7_ILYPC|nr:MarR family transcriptional regulator [Ilyobacter polytropus]ADO83416.1 transcriptional regulator, MarR family [Ilyobacter polytropus DSM 2926]
MTKASRVVGIIYHLRSSFDKYIKKQILKENIPIKWNHAGLFMILSTLGEEIEYREVAELWNKPKSTLSDIVNKYESLGLIEKNCYDNSTRILFIKLTEEGKKYSDRFEEISLEFITKGYEGVTPEEAEVFIKVILNMRKNLD